MMPAKWMGHDGYSMIALWIKLRSENHFTNHLCNRFTSALS